MVHEVTASNHSNYFEGVISVVCIYCGTNKYRKIYENHFGKIPKDDENRTYDIHHLDGNRTNNSLENLKAVSLREHYDIHYQQGDWPACLIMSDRMKLSPEDRSKLSSEASKRRIESGDHLFLDQN